MKHVLFQERCFQCPFAGTERTGDITLGDFWGLNTNVQSHNHIKGTNLIIINSDKGKQMIKTIKGNITFIERSIDEAVEGNETLQQPTRKEKEYDDLWFQLKRDDVDFRTAIKKIYGISEWREYIRFKFYTVRHIAKENIMSILRNIQKRGRA